MKMNKSIEHTFVPKLTYILLHMGLPEDTPEIAAIRAEYNETIRREREQAEARVRAYQEEFTESIGKLSPDEHRDFLQTLLEEAKSSFKHLLSHAKSESVQMTAIKYVFSGAYDIPDKEDPSTALNKLLEQITSSSTEPALDEGTAAPDQQEDNN